MTARTFSAAAEDRPKLAEMLAPPQRPDEIGRFGPYRVLKVLGHGGMGVVFEAEDTLLKRPVALKAMLPALAQQDTHRLRFLPRGDGSATAIENDHIQVIYQVGEDRGVPFIAMPLLRGENLDERLKREKILSSSEMLRIGREIAEGLTAAHARGLIHRDIKPSNIWLEGEHGRVKILDFGLARALDDATLTRPGVALGTPAYMAPEQVNARQVDHRADLFSLGCVLYRMATGETAFRGTDPMATLMAVATWEPPHPRELNPELPSELADLIVRLLAKDPAARPASAQAVVEALQDIVGDRTEVSTPARKTGEPGVRPRRRMMAAVLLCLLGLTGIVAAVAVYRIRTDKGQLIIRTEDPDIKVSVRQGGKLVTIVDLKGRQKVELRSGEYEVALEAAPAELRLSSKTFTLRRGGEAMVTVTRASSTTTTTTATAPSSATATATSTVTATATATATSKASSSSSSKSNASASSR